MKSESIRLELSDFEDEDSYFNIYYDKSFYDEETGLYWEINDSDIEK